MVICKLTYSHISPIWEDFALVCWKSINVPSSVPSVQCFMCCFPCAKETSKRPKENALPASNIHNKDAHMNCLISLSQWLQNQHTQICLYEQARETAGSSNKKGMLGSARPSVQLDPLYSWSEKVEHIWKCRCINISTRPAGAFEVPLRPLLWLTAFQHAGNAALWASAVASGLRCREEDLLGSTGEHPRVGAGPESGRAMAVQLSSRWALGRVRGGSGRLTLWRCYRQMWNCLFPWPGIHGRRLQLNCQRGKTASVLKSELQRRPFHLMSQPSW